MSRWAFCLNGSTLLKLNDALIKKYKETDRLLKAHKVWREEWFSNTLAACPPEMMKILKYVRAMPASAEDDFLQRIQNIDWLINGSNDVKMLLLRVISRRVDEQQGYILDDPLPPGTNMFFKAKDVLKVR